MTRGEFIFEISRAFGLTDEAGSDELILMQRWYTRGVKDVLVKTRCFTDIGTLTLIAGTTDYRIDASVLAMDEVTAPDPSGFPYSLDIVPMRDIFPYLSGAVAATATPSRAAIEGTLLRIAPVPSTAVVLTYIFVPKPTEVAADGTTANYSIDPSTTAYGGISDEYHDCILAYMEWRAAVYDDKVSGLNAEKYRKAYEGLCGDVRKQNRRKGGRGLHRGRTGYPSSRGPSTRNDVYPRYAR